MQLSRILCLTAILSAIADVSLGEAPYQIEWTRQSMGSAYDRGYGVSADRQGSVYVTGDSGGLGNWANFLSKYDEAGNFAWTKFQGGGVNEPNFYGRSVSADSLGNTFVTGYKQLPPGGDKRSDFFLSKYDALGNRVWTRDSGIPLDVPFTSYYQANSVSADGLGNVYITGVAATTSTYPPANPNMFIMKYSGDGSQQWERQLGTSAFDSVNGIISDSFGNIYIAGSTAGALSGANAGSLDAFVAKYNSSGNQLWTKQFGTSAADGANGVSIDSLGNVYLTGTTSGSLGGANAGTDDAFIAKFDSSGDQLWVKQWGTPGFERDFSVTTDLMGSIFVAGESNLLPLIKKFDANGNLLWVSQLGNGLDNAGRGISADEFGNVYVTGTDWGPALLLQDAYLVKFSPVPEPTSFALALFLIPLFVRATKSRIWP